MLWITYLGGRSVEVVGFGEAAAAMVAAMVEAEEEEEDEKASGGDALCREA